jgi:thiol-disulfide isomerase/thioredoxin
VIDFFQTWCPPCQALLPELAKLHEEYEANPQVRILAVNCDPELTPGELEQWCKTNKIPAGLIAIFNSSENTAEVTLGFGVRGVPHIVVIDSNQVIKAMYSGYSEELISKLRLHIDAIISIEEKVAPSRPSLGEAAIGTQQPGA